MEQPGERSFWHRVQQIPRGYIYAVLLAVVVWQVLYPIKLPIIASSTSSGVYQAIQQSPDGKIIVIATDWDASTQPETGPQTEAIIHACFQLKKRFAIMNTSAPMGVKLANDIATRVAPQYGARYGVDWCNWGFKVGTSNVLMAMGKNIPKAIGADFYGKPVTGLPMMRGVRDIRDVGLVVEITGFANMTEAWIGLIQGPYGTPFAAGYTAVMAPGYYAYLDAKQIRGMLVGVKGAAEMEALVARPAKATAIMPAQSAVHLLIIFLIIIGNVGYLMSRPRGRGRR